MHRAWPRTSWTPGRHPQPRLVWPTQTDTSAWGTRGRIRGCRRGERRGRTRSTARTASTAAPRGPPGTSRPRRTAELGAVLAEVVARLADDSGVCRVVDLACGRGELLAPPARPASGPRARGGRRGGPAVDGCRSRSSGCAPPAGRASPTSSTTSTPSSSPTSGSTSCPAPSRRSTGTAPCARCSSTRTAPRPSARRSTGTSGPGRTRGGRRRHPASGWRWASAVTVRGETCCPATLPVSPSPSTTGTRGPPGRRTAPSRHTAPGRSRHRCRTGSATSPPTSRRTASAPTRSLTQRDLLRRLGLTARRRPTTAGPPPTRSATCATWPGAAPSPPSRDPHGLGGFSWAMTRHTRGHA